MGFYQYLTYAVAAGILIGGTDLITGNHLGLGAHFKEAVLLVGDFSLCALGLLILMPALADAILPLASLPARIGFDPAVAASIFAADAGGYPLAVNLAADPNMGRFVGCVVCSMLGAGLIDLPIALGIIRREDSRFFIQGLLIGIISVPFGAVAGGMAAGFYMPSVLLNTIPVGVLSILIGIGLWKIPEKMVRYCTVFSRILEAGAVTGLSLGAVSQLLEIPILPGILPFREAAELVFSMVLVLMGIYPLLRLLLRGLKKPLEALSAKTGFRPETWFGGMIVSVNCFPAFKMYGEMDDRGKILVSAWSVPMVAAFGDFIGFFSALDPEMIAPVIAGKLVSGILALIIGLFFTGNRAAFKESSPK